MRFPYKPHVYGDSGPNGFQSWLFKLVRKRLLKNHISFSGKNGKKCIFDPWLTFPHFQLHAGDRGHRGDASGRKRLLAIRSSPVRESQDGQAKIRSQGGRPPHVAQRLQVQTFFSSSLVSTRFPPAGLSTAHERADWLLHWSFGSIVGSSSDHLSTAAYPTHLRSKHDEG